MRILALLVIGMLATLASACIDLSTGEPLPPQLVAQTVITCLDCQLVDVTGVIDGDTIDTSVGRVRFFGLDTPERGEACFSEATAATKRLAGTRCAWMCFWG